MDNEFFRLINEKLNPQERIFKFKNAELCGKILTVSFMVHNSDYDKFLDERLKKKVKELGQFLLPKDVYFNVKFFKSYADEKIVVNKIIEYIFQEHKSVYPIFANAYYKLETDGDFYTVTITVEKYVYEYAKGINLAESIETFLDTEFMEEIEVAFIEIPNSDASEIIPNKFIPLTTRIIEAKATNVYAKGAINYPKYIVDIIEKKKEEENLTLCGVISDIRNRKIIKPDAKIKEKELFTFILNDTTGMVRCKFFARPRKEFDWIDVFKDGAKLIMTGSYRFDNYDNKFCYIPSAVADAEINFESINIKSNFNFDFGRYMCVTPEPYNDVAQNDLFDVDMTNLDIFKGKVYVAFDLETTGLSIESDEIIEIAGIKIVDGVFKEKFSTFIRPTDSIPKRITEITGIDDDMVSGAPTLKEVIPDFYRFTKDCILIGHNISTFDIPLLNAQASKVKYEFNNDFIDTLTLSRNKLKLSRNKLSDVCNALNIPLIDAHRAINDVSANAKVFLKLMKI